MENEMRGVVAYGTVYGLQCEKTLEVIYVGSTIKPLKMRLQQHLSLAKTGTSKLSNYLKSSDFKTMIFPIEKLLINNYRELRLREALWINDYKRSGFKLLNEKNITGKSKPQKDSILLREVPDDVMLILLEVQKEEKEKRNVKQFSLSTTIIKIIKEWDMKCREI